MKSVSCALLCLGIGFVLAQDSCTVSTSSVAQLVVTEARMQQCFEAMHRNYTSWSQSAEAIVATASQHAYMDLQRQSGPPFVYKLQTLRSLRALACAARVLDGSASAAQRQFALDNGGLCRQDSSASLQPGLPTQCIDATTSTFQFYDALSRVIQRLDDAHASVTKPACFAFLAFVPARATPFHDGETGELRMFLSRYSTFTESLAPQLLSYVPAAAPLPASAGTWQFYEIAEINNQSAASYVLDLVERESRPLSGYAHDRASRVSNAVQGGSAFLRDLRFESMPSPNDSTMHLGLRRCQGPESIVRNAIGSSGSAGDGQAPLDQNSFRIGVQSGVSCDEEGAQLQHVSVEFVYLFTGQDMPADVTDLDSMCAAGAPSSGLEPARVGAAESGGSALPASGSDDRAQAATNSSGSPSQRQQPSLQGSKKWLRRISMAARELQATRVACRLDSSCRGAVSASLAGRGRRQRRHATELEWLVGGRDAARRTAQRVLSRLEEAAASAHRQDSTRAERRAALLDDAEDPPVSEYGIDELHELSRILSGRAPRHPGSSMLPAVVRRMKAGATLRVSALQARQLQRRAGRSAGMRRLQSESESPSSSSSGVSGGRIDVLRSFNEDDGLGVYMVTLEILPPALAAVSSPLQQRIIVLDLTTFLPAGVLECLNEESLPQGQTADECFNSFIAGFIADGPNRALTEMEEQGADAILVDLSSNGGGLIALAQATAIALTPVLGNNPALAVTTVELRPTELLTLAAKRFEEQSVSSDDLEHFPGAGLTDPSDTSLAASEGQHGWGFLYDNEAGTRLPTRRHGGQGYKMTVPVFPVPPAAAASLAADEDGFIRYPVVLDRSTLTAVTDGMCGSACSQFLRVLKDNGLATVLGGSPGRQLSLSSSSAFCGGFVTSSAIADTIAWLEEAEEVAGFDPGTALSQAGVPSFADDPESGVVFSIVAPNSTLELGITIGSSLSPSRPAWPIQFDPAIPDGQDETPYLNSLAEPFAALRMVASAAETQPAGGMGGAARLLWASAGIAMEEAQAAGRQGGIGDAAREDRLQVWVVVLAIMVVLLGMAVMWLACAACTAGRAGVDHQALPTAGAAAGAGEGEGGEGGEGNRSQGVPVDAGHHRQGHGHNGKGNGSEGVGTTSGASGPRQPQVAPQGGYSAGPRGASGASSTGGGRSKPAAYV